MTFFLGLACSIYSTRTAAECMELYDPNISTEDRYKRSVLSGAAISYTLTSLSDDPLAIAARAGVIMGSTVLASLIPNQENQTPAIPGAMSGLVGAGAGYAVATYLGASIAVVGLSALVGGMATAAVVSRIANRCFRT